MIGTALLLALTVATKGPDLQSNRIQVNGIELQYVERGRGEPLILLHGGSGDLSSWAAQMGPFSARYRVIAYSRRHSFPNINPVVAANESVLLDAADLAALIRELKLGRVHLVGASYGGYTALALAMKHPDMVRSLVLAEPPVHAWVRDLPGGEAIYREFIDQIWNPAARQVREGNDRQGVTIFVDGLFGPGAFDHLSPERAAIVERNTPAIKALLLSNDPFSKLDKAAARALQVPALIVTGANTIRIHKWVDEEIARVLPRAELVTIADSGHATARDNPRAFDEAVLRFLGSLKHQAD